MQEHYLRLDRIKQGLNPNTEPDRNSSYGLNAANFMPTDLGLQRNNLPYVNIAEGTGLTPYVFYTGYGMMAFTEDEVAPFYKIDGTGNLTYVQYLGSKFYHTGDPWHVGQVGDYIVAANGAESMYYYDFDTNTWSDIPEATSDSIVPWFVSGMTDFYGQQLFYWNTGPTGIGDPIIDEGDSYIFWSRPGRVGVVPNRRNSGGWHYLPELGEIKAAHPVGRQMAVFGDKGVCMLSAWGQPGWGKKMISEAGIIGEHCVAGDYGHLFYLALDGLWVITPETTKRLGYEREIQSIMSSGDIRLTYDKQKEFLFISNETEHLIYYAKTGCMTGFMNYNVQAIGDDATSYFTTSDISYVGPSVWKSEVIDFNRTGYKTLRWVQPHGYLPGDAEAQLRCYYEDGGTAYISNRHTLKPDNTAHFGLTGKYFHVTIEVEDDNNLSHIDSVELRWQAEDRRYIRGTSAPSRSRQDTPT